MAKININNYREVFKWQYEAYPLFTSVYIHAAGIKTKNKYFVDWSDFINKFENGHLLAFKPRQSLLKAGDLEINELLNQGKEYDSQIKKLQQEINEAIIACAKAKQTNTSSLAKWWKPMQKALSDTANILFAFDYTFDDFLNNLQQSSPKEFKIVSEYIKNTRLSFMDEAEIYLLQLNKKYRGDISKIFPEFIKKFGWFQNTYRGVFNISESWLRYHLLEAKKRKRHNIVQKIKTKAVPKKYRAIISLANQIIPLRDDKKKLLLMAVELLDNWIKSLSLKNGWQYEDMLWLSVDEILAITKKNKKENLQLARRCRKMNRRIGLMYYGGYKDIPATTWNKIVILYEKQNSKKEIKGISASPGICRGKAKIIFDAKLEANKFKTGDILITSMTRPEFLPLMRKARAFVTDEGGISCHAAIIAREMKKPCIIATKTATRVIKNGEKIEVDANNGIIRVIK